LVIFPLALLGLSRLPLVPSYFLIFYPLPFLLAALPLAEGWGWLRRRIRPFAADLIFGMLLLAVTTYQLTYMSGFLKKVREDGGARGDYGATYAVSRAMAGQWRDGGSPLESLAVEDLPILALAVSHPLEEETAKSNEFRRTAHPYSLSRQQLARPRLTALQHAEAERSRQLALRLLQGR
jgi:hypothetical protein